MLYQYISVNHTVVPATKTAVQRELCCKTENDHTQFGNYIWRHQTARHQISPHFLFSLFLFCVGYNIRAT